MLENDIYIWIIDLGCEINFEFQLLLARIWSLGGRNERIKSLRILYGALEICKKNNLQEKEEKLILCIVNNLVELRVRFHFAIYC